LRLFSRSIKIMTVYLVSCVSKKRTEPVPARDLYVSSWFLKARAYVESKDDRWFILSAEHGLLAPESIVSPYEKSLNALPIAARRVWAERVKAQMKSELVGDERVVVLAGKRYREFLMPFLYELSSCVEIPMEGLSIGQQLQWFGDQMKTGRTQDIETFYQLTQELERRVGGKRHLLDCDGRMPWPQRGVYFFYEDGENRTNGDSRIVRVGTHGLKAGSKATLWKRLAQHQGTIASGGGNHRGSIFRLLGGTALHAREETTSDTWGIGSDMGSASEKLGIARDKIRSDELSHEIAVSDLIRGMPFLWLDVPDDPGPASLRGVIERGAIALLSNYEKDQIDPQSASWLGAYCDRPGVRKSGLWNNNHVDETYDPSFLVSMRGAIEDLA
jgi:hypothetical protein